MSRSKSCSILFQGSNSSSMRELAEVAAENKQTDTLHSLTVSSTLSLDFLPAAAAVSTFFCLSVLREVKVSGIDKQDALQGLL